MLISNFQEFLGLRRLQYWHFSKSGWVSLGQDLPSIIWLEKEALSFVRGDDKVQSTCFNNYNNVFIFNLYFIYKPKFIDIYRDFWIVDFFNFIYRFKKISFLLCTFYYEIELKRAGKVS